jgi:hypothetical protein
LFGTRKLGFVILRVAADEKGCEVHVMNFFVGLDVSKGKFLLGILDVQLFHPYFLIGAKMVRSLMISS